MKTKRSVAQKKSEFLLQLPKVGGLIRTACKKTNIGKSMLYVYISRDPIFAAKIKDIEDSFVDLVECRLLEMAMAGDRLAIMFYLKAKARDRGYR